VTPPADRQSRLGTVRAAPCVHALLVLLLLGGVAVALRARRAAQPVRLPDGATVRFCAVTWGRGHTHVPGGLVSRICGFLAQHPFLARLGLAPPPPLAFTTTNDVVTCWFAVRAETVPNSTISQALVREAPAGLTARATGYRVWTVSTNEQVLAVTFANFPRSQRALLVELQAFGRQSGTNWWRPLAFRAPNPARAAARRLDRPEAPLDPALGATQSVGELTVVLDRLVTGLPRTNILTPVAPRSAARPLSLALLTVRAGDRLLTNWWPTEIEGWHPNGNYFRCAGSPGVWPNGQVGLFFEQALWAATRAPWRVRVTLARTSGFDPADLWTNNLPDVAAALSAATEQRPAPVATTERHGGTVTLSRLAPGSQPGGGLNLHVRLDNAPAGVGVAVARVTADGVRPVATRLLARSRGEGQTAYVFELAPAAFRALEIVLAVHTNYVCDFTARAQCAALPAAPPAGTR